MILAFYVLVNLFLGILYQEYSSEKEKSIADNFDQKNKNNTEKLNKPAQNRIKGL